MAPFTEIKILGQGADLKIWHEDQGSFDTFSLECQLATSYSDIKSRIRGPLRTEHKSGDMGNEGGIRGAHKEFVGIKPSKTKNSKDE